MTDTPNTYRELHKELEQVINGSELKHGTHLS